MAWWRKAQRIFHTTQYVSVCVCTRTNATQWKSFNLITFATFLYICCLSLCNLSSVHHAGSRSEWLGECAGCLSFTEFALECRCLSLSNWWRRMFARSQLDRRRCNRDSTQMTRSRFVSMRPFLPWPMGRLFWEYRDECQRIGDRRRSLAYLNPHCTLFDFLNAIRRRTSSMVPPH